VRFGAIRHLPGPPGAPQQFEYATRLAPGLRISGRGESLGDRARPDGTAWSGLKFWSSDRRSIVRSGSGYWRYVPTEAGIRFLTRYDYRPRWGRAGEAIDRRLFRPLFGWSTAWSFDRLRLWLESGITPERSRNQALAHAAAVGALAGVWTWQGIVPKLLVRDRDELAMIRRSGLFPGRERGVLTVMGVGEVVLAAVILSRSRERWPFVAQLVVVPALTVGALLGDRASFTRPFNPASLNVAVLALVVVALATRSDLPSARAPRRTPPDDQPDVQPGAGPLP
jgi:hypothetical protein